MTRAERWTDRIADHGEGPVWFPDEGRLRMVDMLAGDVLAVSEGGAVAERLHVDAVAAAVRPRYNGGFVIAGERGFFLTDDGSNLRFLGTAVDNPAIRFNEGGCAPDGAFLCGTKAYDDTPGAGALYRLMPDGQVDCILTDVTISNGLGFSGNGTLCYYTDTAVGRIDVFDYADGELSGRRPFVTIEPDDGAPDGLCIDANDGVWVALWGGSQVRHYDATGQLDDVLYLPVTQVTACALGGNDGRQLFITTSGYQLGDSQPSAGSVFRATSAVAAAPTLKFAG